MRFIERVFLLYMYCGGGEFFCFYSRRCVFKFKFLDLLILNFVQGGEGFCLMFTL